MISILVVDDDAKLTQSVCAYLNNSGYQAKGVLSVERAYEGMSGVLYDLIMCDIMMPGTDGVAFAENVSTLYTRFPILFMSARDDMAS